MEPVIQRGRAQLLASVVDLLNSGVDLNDGDYRKKNGLRTGADPISETALSAAPSRREVFEQTCVEQPTVHRPIPFRQSIALKIKIVWKG